MKRCIFAGTFDPFTVGHADTVEKALKLFDEVVISIGENKFKRCMFTAEERKEMISAVYADDPRVRVVIWEGVIADLLKKEDTLFYVRGVRNATDFEYERSDFYASKDINGEIIELFLPSEQRHMHISSTLVKNCIAFEKSFESYVPQQVFKYIEGKGCLQKK